MSGAGVTIGPIVGGEGPDELKEACGLFGVWAPGEDVARLTFFGLFSLQHRGQESAGMAVSDGHRIVVYRELGLVSQVFDERTLATLQGDLGIGHTRYSTTGSTTWENAQPSFKTDGSRGLALGHNGNLVNTGELARKAGRRGNASTDSDIVATLLSQHLEDGLEKAALEVLPLLSGAFSFVMMDERTVFAARDPHGIRPLAIGRLPRGYCVASETCAFDVVGAQYVREVEPGELVRISRSGVESLRFAPQKQHQFCVFEHVYFSRPDSLVFGRPVDRSREMLGRLLAREQPADADLVVPVPDSGVPAAIGYALESGLPFRMGLIRSHYMGRTFIEPEQSIRDFGVRLKLNPVRALLEGKRVVLVDDSIVRGTTSRKIVRMMREAGATQVHMRISCPPTISPCYYGVDTPTREELLASDASCIRPRLPEGSRPDLTGAARSLEEIRLFLDADSVGYLSLESLRRAVSDTTGSFCTSCYTGVYVPENVQLEVSVPAAAGREQVTVPEAEGKHRER